MQPRFRPWGPGPRSLCLSLACFFFLGALAAGCGSSPSQPPVIIHPGPGSLRIVPDSADVQTGTQITFQAEVKDSLGHVVTAPCKSGGKNRKLALAAAEGEIADKQQDLHLPQ